MSSIFFVLAFFLSFVFFPFKYLLCYVIHIIFYFWRTGLSVSFWTEWMLNMRKRRSSSRGRLLVSNHKRIVEPCWGDSAGWLRLRNPRGVPNFVFGFFFSVILTRHFFPSPHLGPTPRIISAFPMCIYNILCASARKSFNKISS